MKQDALNSFIEFMTESLKSAKDFTLSQVPEVAKEIIRYNIASDIIWLTGAAFFLGIAYKLHTKVRDKNWSEDTYVVVAILTIVSVIMTVVQLGDLAKLVIAPRVYLLEYFTALIHSYK